MTVTATHDLCTVQPHNVRTIRGGRSTWVVQPQSPEWISSTQRMNVVVGYYWLMSSLYCLLPVSSTISAEQCTTIQKTVGNVKENKKVWNLKGCRVCKTQRYCRGGRRRRYLFRSDSDCKSQVARKPWLKSTMLATQTHAISWLS